MQSQYFLCLNIFGGEKVAGRGSKEAPRRLWAPLRRYVGQCAFESNWCFNLLHLLIFRNLFYFFIYLDKILFGYKAAIMYLVNILSRYTPKICFGFVSYRDIRCVHDFTISNENVFHLRDFFIKKMNKFEGELNKNGTHFRSCLCLILQHYLSPYSK